MLSFLCLALLLRLSHAASPKTPDYMKFCKRHDPEVSKCLIPALQQAITHLSDTGEPSLGILPLDPFRFSRFDINQGSGPVSINLTYTDLDFSGIKNIHIEKITPDWDNYKIELEYTLGKTQYIGDYKISGKVLILPVTGSGKGNVTMVGSKMRLLLSGKGFTKDGKEYLDVQGCKLTPRALDRVYIKFDNLFNGDKTLGDQMNKFVDENWREVTEELKGPMLNGLCQGVKQVANKIFHKIPLETIAPL